MSSCLVETVMINVEDFADSFLTCGTCLSRFDNNEHSPKLLPCSHTVCRICIGKIIETNNSATPNTSSAIQPATACTFRCPICRENITVPRGDVSIFPPAFLVNQLLDLLATQRRDKVPRCAEHPAYELLFCETCDNILCAQCQNSGPCIRPVGSSSPSSNRGGLPFVKEAEVYGEHNVVSLSVATKRCSELAQYKAQLCDQKLDCALQAVSEELQRLDVSAGSCTTMIEESFNLVRQLVEQRRNQLVQEVETMRERKRVALTDQYTLIEHEKRAVQEQCDLAAAQSDVRSITKSIAVLNERLDQVSGLMVPRENAFIGYKSQIEESQSHLVEALSSVGAVSTTTTYPPLCTAEIPSLTVHLTSEIIVHSVDISNTPRDTGSDPIIVEMHPEEDRSNRLPLTVMDRGNGTYSVRVRPRVSGQMRLSVNILEREIRGSPFLLDVNSLQTPVWTNKTGGLNGTPFRQPFGTAYCQDRLLVLDTGNSRIVCLDASSGEALSECGQEVMAAQGGTGVAADIRCPDSRIWVANWRRKSAILFDINTNQIVHEFKSSLFEEPTGVICSPSSGQTLIIDRGAGRIFGFDPREYGTADRSSIDKLSVICTDSCIKQSTAVAELADKRLLIAGSSLKIFSPDRKTSSLLWAGARSQFTGLSVDQDRNILLCSRLERSKSVVQVFEPSQLISDSLLNYPDSVRSGKEQKPCSTDSDWFTYEIQTENSLKRPAGLCVIPELSQIAGVDIGSNSVYMLRYN